MLFLGHSACAVEHMLLHSGKHPQPSSQQSEYFMDILNGEIIDDGTLQKRDSGLKEFFLSVAFIRLSIKCLSCGKGKIFITTADIKTEHQHKCGMCEEAQRCSPLGMMGCSLLAARTVCSTGFRSSDWAYLPCLELIGKIKESISVCFADFQD